MLKSFRKFKLTFVTFIFFLPLSHAQFEAGIMGGVCNYQGDLSDPTFVELKVQPGFGAFMRYTPQRFITIRGNFIQAKMKASDLQSPNPSTRYRGVKLETTIRELSVIGEFNVLGNSNERNYELGGVLFNPFIYAGIGLVARSGEPVAPSDTQPYPFPEQGSKNIVPACPIGFGLKVQFGEHVSVGMDFGVRMTFSDYLDGVSKIANPKSKDYYSFGNLTLAYCFGEY